MNEKKSKSLDINDYEILIRRRGENDYASYCPQLNQMITGTEHEEVRELMVEQVEKHIRKIKSEAVN